MQMCPTLSSEAFLEAGFLACHAGEATTALVSFRAAARLRSWEGRHLLATFGYLGRGTPEERVAGERVFGDLGMRTPLSHRRAMGLGIDPSWSFPRLANIGFRAAQMNLFVMHAIGDGMPRDHARALYYCHLAAEAGDMRAQAILGRAYQQGEGVKRDLQRAEYWRQVAAAGRAADRRNLPRLDAPNDPEAKLLPDHLAEFSRQHGGSIWCLGASGSLFETEEVIEPPATRRPSLRLQRGSTARDDRWLRTLDERWSLNE